MAKLLAISPVSIGINGFRRYRFCAGCDGPLHWLSEECWGSGSGSPRGIHDDLVIERQVEQPESDLGL